MDRSTPVLLIEDDPPTRFAYARLLMRAGFAVQEARSGQDALDLLDGGFRPSVVVIDLGLPDVGGRDILTTMHDDPLLRFVPAVVVTGLPPHEVRVTADAVLFKPVVPRELIGIVGKLHSKANKL